MLLEKTEKEGCYRLQVQAPAEGEPPGEACLQRFDASGVRIADRYPMLRVLPVTCVQVRGVPEYCFTLKNAHGYLLDVFDTQGSMQVNEVRFFQKKYSSIPEARTTLVPYAQHRYLGVLRLKHPYRGCGESFLVGLDGLLDRSLERSAEWHAQQHAFVLPELYWKRVPVRVHLLPVLLLPVCGWISFSVLVAWLFTMLHG